MIGDHVGMFCVSIACVCLLGTGVEEYSLDSCIGDIV